MTRTQTRAYGVSNPSIRQPLLEAMLCVFAWLVSNVGSMLATIFNRNPRDWHTDAAREDQLSNSTDTCAPAFILRDDRFAIPQDEAGGCLTESRPLPRHDSHQALILRDLRKAQIVSKDEGGLTALSPRITRHIHRLSFRKPRRGYPGSIPPQSESENGSRLALRLAGMTSVSAFTA